VHDSVHLGKVVDTLNKVIVFTITWLPFGLCLQEYLESNSTSRCFEMKPSVAYGVGRGRFHIDVIRHRNKHWSIICIVWFIGGSPKSHSHGRADTNEHLQSRPYIMPLAKKLANNVILFGKTWAACLCSPSPESIDPVVTDDCIRAKRPARALGSCWRCLSLISMSG
jgi:hypothetical protein